MYLWVGEEGGRGAGEGVGTRERGIESILKGTVSMFVLAGTVPPQNHFVLPHINNRYINS